jgi:hypothetical protein
MKKNGILFFFLLFSTMAMGQYLTVEEVNKALEKEMKAKKLDYKSMANTIMQELPLDKNGGFTYVIVVEAPNKTKEQLYITLNAWFLSIFDGEGIIMNDKEIGCIMAKERFNRISANGALSSSNKNYEVDIEPIIRTDIKDGKVRITYNVPCYELRDITNKVWGKQLFAKNKSKSLSFSESYPYNSKGFEKKMMTKALVFTHYYSTLVVMDIENAIKNGVVGNEADDNW